MQWLWRTCIWSCGHNIYFIMLFQTSCQLVAGCLGCMCKILGPSLLETVGECLVHLDEAGMDIFFPSGLLMVLYKKLFLLAESPLPIQVNGHSSGPRNDHSIPFQDHSSKPNTNYILCCTLTGSRICYMHAAKFNQLMCTYILMLLRCYHSYCCLSSKTKLARYRLSVDYSHYCCSLS